MISTSRVFKWRGLANSGLRLPCSLEVIRYDDSSCTFKSSTLTEFLSIFRFDQNLNKRRNKPISLALKEKYVHLFHDYSLIDLRSLVLDRIFLDGLCGVDTGRGAPLDIDLIAKGHDNAWYLLEVKEKYKSKGPPSGFGMDVRRIESLTKLETVLQIPAVYVVRHVSDQYQRRLIEWCFIRWTKFCMQTVKSSVIEGGTGMRSETSSNPTRVCDYKHFSRRPQ
jgi:hypothetical protein